jgi:D-alanine transaminase
MNDLVFLNGNVLPRSRAMVSIDDRGFLFGDAVYEVIRTLPGRFIEPERHLNRLARSLREISIPAPDLDLLGIATDLLGRNGLDQREALIYLQVSRGAAQRQHAFPPDSVQPTVLMSVAALEPRREQTERGVAAITAPDLRWSRCDIKSVNLLANVLAAQRASEAGAFEAILIRDECVTEATRSNVFAVIDGTLRTHPTGPFILPGVTREVVMELCGRVALPVRGEAITRNELTRAEELFVTGTTSDVMPVVTLDGRPVGSGRPGPLTRRLSALLAREMGLNGVGAGSRHFDGDAAAGLDAMQ